MPSLGCSDVTMNATLRAQIHAALKSVETIHEANRPLRPAGPPVHSAAASGGFALASLLMAASGVLRNSLPPTATTIPVAIGTFNLVHYILAQLAKENPTPLTRPAGLRRAGAPGE